MRLNRGNVRVSPQTVSFSGIGAGLAGGQSQESMLVLGQRIDAHPVLRAICGRREEHDLEKREHVCPRMERVAVRRGFV